MTNLSLNIYWIILILIFTFSCKINDVELKNISLKNVKTTTDGTILTDVEITINNKNAFSLKLIKLEILLKNDSTEVGTVSLIEPIKIFPNSKKYNAQLKIEINKDYKDLKNILINSFISNKTISYDLKIRVKKLFILKTFTLSN
ncbi:MAG: hypothetical protein N3A01_00940 [Bacteroidales bacterium]|nr:hypothetical protein [Bacteroidales bacterium]